MVGNDVVDLADGESSEASLHPRFDQRVFDEREQALILASADANRERWSLWAAKEAAYKLARKLDASVIFSPRRFRVEFSPSSADSLAPKRRAHVSHVDGPRLEVQIEAGEDWLHALASRPEESSSSRIWGLARLECVADGSAGAVLPGRAVRALALREIARHLGVREDELSIERSCRVPRLKIRGRAAPLDLSLSHHGLFVAFACHCAGPAELGVSA